MKVIVTFVLALLTLGVFAQSPVITAKEVAAEIKANKDLVIIDVMAPDAFAKQHLQGAVNIFHKDLYKPGAIEGQLKSPEELAAIFGKKGVSNTAKIVLYDDGSQKYNSRVWWTLKYLGANNVFVLHKEMNQWAQARLPLTSSVGNAKPASFTPTVNNDMFVDMATLKAKLGSSLLLLDAREPDEYNGVDKDKRSKGHLPGAVLMNFKEVLTATGAYKTKDEIIASAAKFGATPEKEIIVYCQTSIKAAVLYAALKEIAGFSNVKLYFGAYTEWASVAENPIVK